MKTLIQKVALGVLGLVMVLAVAVAGINAYNNFNNECSVGDDECIEKVLTDLRTERNQQLKTIDESIASWTNIRLETETRSNDRINALKGKFSTGYTVKAMQQGKKENVIPQLLTLKGLVIQQAYADSQSRESTENDIPVEGASSIVQPDISPITISNNTYSPDRYRKVLASIGSPYSEIPIAQYCQQAGLGVLQCDMLLGIANAESNNGMEFRCNGKTREEAISLGQNYYFNAVGIKDFRNDGMQKNPDSNGCYLRKFESWNDFWQWYPAHMLKAYHLNDIENVYQISGTYVYGQSSLRNMSWTKRANAFIEKINNSL